MILIVFVNNIIVIIELGNDDERTEIEHPTEQPSTRGLFLSNYKLSTGLTGAKV